MEPKQISNENPIAYFCAEYALTADLQIYAGGLGVLAGDLLREADDQSFPMIAVGLYYEDGYETPHQVNEKGSIDVPHVHASPKDYGLSELLEAETQTPILVDIPIQDKTIKAKVWKWSAGKIPLYLLNTNVEENSEEDRKITDHLYVKDRETRFKQAIVLGIGGVRLLDRLQIQPSIYHMNEGFASLLCLELVKKEMSTRHIGFDEAKKNAAQKVVYTNHTLVTAGHDNYEASLLNVNLAKYVTELGIPIDQILRTGSPENSTVFSSTLFAMRMAGKINAVSRIHSKKAAEIWPSNPMTPITNGIHLGSWDALAESNIWQSHIENKKVLLQKISSVTGNKWNEAVFIIGWARRLVSYKRPLALFEDIEHLKKILSEKNARIVISGTLHPGDAESQNILGDFRNILGDKLKGYAVFLPDYNLSLARIMVAGCDIWLNTPIIGFEACGTSGMKAALNGVLPVSTRDGWMDEIDLYGIGWQIDDNKINESILNTLEQKVIPLYFDRDQNGIPQKWIVNMINARKLIIERFSTKRMLQDYIDQLYLPLLSSQT